MFNKLDSQTVERKSKVEQKQILSKLELHQKAGKKNIKSYTRL